MPMRRFLPLLAALGISLNIVGCANLSFKGGTSGTTVTDRGYIDNDTGDKIRQEEDEFGNLRDCTVGKSSSRSQLPSCNEIVDRRQAAGSKSAESSDNMLDNKLSGTRLYTLPNGGKIRVSAAVKYNDEAVDGMIVGVTISNIGSTRQAFESLFIDSSAYVEVVFVDADEFALLAPARIPLNVQRGQRENISYRKKFGETTSDVVAVVMQARLPVKSVREYQKIARLEIAFKPG
jgi:hypothetical protein